MTYNRPENIQSELVDRSIETEEVLKKREEVREKSRKLADAFSSLFNEEEWSNVSKGNSPELFTHTLTAKSKNSEKESVSQNKSGDKEAILSMIADSNPIAVNSSFKSVEVMRATQSSEENEEWKHAENIQINLSVIQLDRFELLNQGFEMNSLDENFLLTPAEYNPSETDLRSDAINAIMSYYETLIQSLTRTDSERKELNGKWASKESFQSYLLDQGHIIISDLKIIPIDSENYRVTATIWQKSNKFDSIKPDSYSRSSIWNLLKNEVISKMDNGVISPERADEILNEISILAVPIKSSEDAKKFYLDASKRFPELEGAKDRLALKEELDESLSS